MKRLKKQTLNVRLEAHASPLVITFGELISLYLSNISCNGRSRPFRVRKWIDHFGHLAAWDFTAEHRVGRLAGSGGVSGRILSCFTDRTCELGPSDDSG